MNRRYILKMSAVTVLAFSTIGLSHAQKSIILSSTTSTEQSGLFKHLLPAFEKKTGIQVKVVAVGTGQALDIGRRGDADVVMVHDKVAEEKFVAEGFAEKRIEVMYNDFVLIGPKADPAKNQRWQRYSSSPSKGC
jgi:tungstate transport system substrate-binding protein